MSADVHQYFRGSDVVMAADLAVTPVSEINVQASGDVDVLSFGYYRSPGRGAGVRRRLLRRNPRAPWEWDVGRMAASMAVAGGGHGGRLGPASGCAGCGRRLPARKWRGRPGRTG